MVRRGKTSCELIHSIHARAWHCQVNLHASDISCRDTALHGPVLRGLPLAHIRSLTSILFIFPTSITQLSWRSHFILACQTDLFGMHLPHPATLILYFIVLATASPIAWPDDKLEEINALRARGVPEVSRLSQLFDLSQRQCSFYRLSV